jgi:hypothetical protein
VLATVGADRGAQEGPIDLDLHGDAPARAERRLHVKGDDDKGVLVARLGLEGRFEAVGCVHALPPCEQGPLYFAMHL